MPPVTSKQSAPRPWYRMEAKAEGEAEIFIYDEIVDPLIAELWGIGQSAKSFAKDLKALGPVTALSIRINSRGGDVFEGQAIHSLLRAHPANKTVHVDGLAASIASVIAMAGDRIIMPENAMMMVHDPSGGVWGTAQDMRQWAEALDKIGATIVAAYQRKTGQAKEKLAELMHGETWMTAAEAKELGFADEIAEPVQVTARIDLSIFKSVPETARQRFAVWPEPDAKVLRPAAVATAPPIQPQTKEITMDLETLRKDHPAIAAALIEEGRKAGEKTERDRVAKIHASFTKVWGATPTAAELAVRDEIVALELTVEESEKTFKARKLALVTAVAPQSAGGGADPAPAGLEGLQGEARWKAEWDKNIKNVRDEFLDEKEYLAFKRAEAKGNIRILGQRTAA